MNALLRTAAFLLTVMLALTSEAAAETSKLSRIFQFEMLNAQLAYLESITGPAMHVRAISAGVQSRDYPVEGCRVTAYVKGGVVLAYSLGLSPRCNFSLNDFLGNDYPSTEGLTIGGFANGAFGADLRAQSTCIYLCGNAADPTVDFTWEGPHAANFISIVLTVVLASDEAVSAAERWEAAMRKTEDTDYIEAVKFNCTPKYDRDAITAFSGVQVNEITVGFYQPDAGTYKKTCAKEQPHSAARQSGRTGRGE
jgi:hypothetical protein